MQSPLIVFLRVAPFLVFSRFPGGVSNDCNYFLERPKAQKRQMVQKYRFLRKLFHVRELGR